MAFMEEAFARDAAAATAAEERLILRTVALCAGLPARVVKAFIVSPGGPGGPRHIWLWVADVVQVTITDDERSRWRSKSEGIQYMADRLSEAWLRFDPIPGDPPNIVRGQD